MSIVTESNGWTKIYAAGLTIVIPTNDHGMSYDRCEIRCGGSRVFVESHDDGPLVSAVEIFSS